MSYTKRMQALYAGYERSGRPMPADLNDVADWLLKTGQWKPAPELARKKLVEDLGRALREEYFEDEDGNRVRAKHVATVKKGGAQFNLWGDMRTASHEHLSAAFAGRRNGVIGDLRQLKTDADWYNKHREGHPPVQIVLDFTQDIAEIEAAKAARRERAAKRRRARALSENGASEAAEAA